MIIMSKRNAIIGILLVTLLLITVFGVVFWPRIATVYPGEITISGTIYDDYITNESSEALVRATNERTGETNETFSAANGAYSLNLTVVEDGDAISLFATKGSKIAVDVFIAENVSSYSKNLTIQDQSDIDRGGFTAAIIVFIVSDSITHKGIDNAELKFVHQTTGNPTTVFTDDQGTVNPALLLGTYNLTITHSDYKTKKIEVVVSQVTFDRIDRIELNRKTVVPGGGTTQQLIPGFEVSIFITSIIVIAVINDIRRRKFV